MTRDQREDKIGELLRELVEQQEQLTKMQCMIADHYADISGLESDRVQVAGKMETTIMAIRDMSTDVKDFHETDNSTVIKKCNTSTTNKSKKTR